MPKVFWAAAVVKSLSVERVPGAPGVPSDSSPVTVYICILLVWDPARADARSSAITITVFREPFSTVGLRYGFSPALQPGYLLPAVGLPVFFGGLA